MTLAPQTVLNHYRPLKVIDPPVDRSARLPSAHWMVVTVGRCVLETIAPEVGE